MLSLILLLHLPSELPSRTLSRDGDGGDGHEGAVMVMMVMKRQNK